MREFFCFLIMVAVAGCASMAPPAVSSQGEGAAQLTCGSLPPPTDQDSIARVGALFSRPESATDLMHNLKLAYATDLIHQPGFYDSANLMKFFAGTAVTWRERSPISEGSPAFRDITITADETVFPRITIQLRTGCPVGFRPEAANRLRPDHLSKSLLIRLWVGTDMGFTLGAVRSEFGPANTQYVDNGMGASAEGPPDERSPSPKGILSYENQAGARPGIERAEVTFHVRLGSLSASDGPAVLIDSSELGEIQFSEVWR
jgi:hypothetical protein